MNQYVIILAGGKGLRMGTTVPKQFLEIKGKAIILHTLGKFEEALPSAELLLVLPKPEIPRWQEISHGTAFENIKTTSGGDTRFESVKAGLRLIESEGVVGVHDAVRPFVSIEAIQTTFNKAKSTGAAIPVVDLKDSIRKVDSDQSVAVNRSNFKIVQTPQCFDVNVLKQAYQQVFNSSFTDDASVVEADGKKVSLVKGNYSNIKITTIEDLKIAEILM
ncbi:2-C-methyl-D-erythritol 4-phosphate cytidylyltransferase [Vicingaceae bacterium]|nr:2-C-methyl-D-erythritol 4-phosphate cytidylyltransferase [Vicingaceae bacterium]